MLLTDEKYFHMSGILWPVRFQKRLSLKFFRRISIYFTVKQRVFLILPSSELLRGVRCFKTDVSGLSIRPIFKGRASWAV